jgi:uncharacterized protein YcbK (DUF882 family)
MARYFDESEFACECCGQVNISPILLEKLDELRHDYGYPIYVSSGYRCPAHNEEIKGEPNSTHMRGLAADIYVDGDYEEFYRRVRGANSFDGVGYYPIQEFVHVDVRNESLTPNYYLW